MKQTLLLLISIILTSCAASIKPVSLKHRNYNDSPLNQPLKAEIGDKLIVKGEEEYQDAYRITNTPSFKITLLDFPFTSGDVLPLAGQTQNFDLFFTRDKNIQGSVAYTCGIARDKKTGQIKPFANSVNGFAVRDIEGFTAEPTTYNNPNCEKCLKKEFIYNGKVGNSLKFVYREYIRDLARPAFTQDLQYDLADGNTVGFKGLRIEVINASNTNIEYKILSDFTN